MAFIPIPDSAKVIFSMLTSSVPWSFSLYFSQPGFEDTDLEDLLTALNTTFVPALAAPMCTVTDFTQLTAYDMRTIDGSRVIQAAITSGLDADPPVAVGTALVVSLYAGGRGKWNQGRVFITGLPENEISITSWTQVTADAVEDAFADLVATPPTGWVPVIASRYLNGVPRATAVISQVKTVQVRNLIAGNQRRRLRRS